MVGVLWVGYQTGTPAGYGFGRGVMGWLSNWNPYGDVAVWRDGAGGGAVLIKFVTYVEKVSYICTRHTFVNKYKMH